MLDYYYDLFIQYRSRGVIIDANLLLLYFIGSYDAKRIGKFKRTNCFTVEDFQLLHNIIAFFHKIITTPHILTEVSNLSTSLPEGIRPDYFTQVAQQIPRLDEIYSASKQLSSLPDFKKFGLTDAAIIYEASQKHLVLTNEFPLSGYLQAIDVDVINFNHIRPLNWSNWF